MTKEFLSSKFSTKDMGKANVILGIRIKHESNGIEISQSLYIEKVLKKFNYFDCTLVSTIMDTSEKLMPNNDQAVSQLKYSRVISCLLYAMTYTRLDIAFAMGKLSKYTSNLEGYTDVSWINNAEDNSSTSGWVFLLGGATGKEAEWLRNLVLKIPLWSKPISPISILFDSAATLAKAYSQMYNEKSRHLGVRHSMIRELITNEFLVIHQPPQETSVEILHDQENVINSVQTILRKFNRYSFFETPKVLLLAWDRVSKIKDAFGNKQYKPKDIQELFRKLFNDVQNIHEELAEYINAPSWNHHAFYNNDEDENEDYNSTITPDFSITDSLSMGDEHLDTILEKESDEFIKYSVKNLVPNPSKSKDLSNIGSECDVPICDDFTNFSNSLFDADEKFSSSDDESFSDEDVSKEIYSNSLFDEEIISIKIYPHHFNAKSDLIESLLNQDSSIISSPKFDSLLEEFSGELAHIDLILPGINEADFNPEAEIHLVEKLLYDNSSPRPPEEFYSKNSDAIIESFSPSLILVEGSDSLMEEIDIFLTSDDSIPSGIKNDDYDSKGDIIFLEEMLSNDSSSLPENESFHFDVPSSPRPSAKPSDVGIFFEHNTGLLTAKVVDISERSVHVPNVLPTQPTLCPVINTLLPFSSKNEDKVHLLSHRGSKACQLSS
uniref:Zinc finger, CCHC-type n=1 Tax=Tanacetum cinerariifolium TaxID=118510 RepID=A0A699GWP2_TANCI|nr:zinc finger, CCHC-type [Tanacetum cinerariifolium]